MRRPAELWKLRERSLSAACKAARRGEPEGLHDLRVALRRVATTANALGRRATSRRAKRILRSLSKQRQIEVDRRLLTRVGQLGVLLPDAAAALAARWDKLAAREEKRVTRAAQGRRMEELKRRLDRLGRRNARKTALRLEKAWRRAESRLARPLDVKDDSSLHRYRIAARKARYLGEDLAALGLTQFGQNAERQQALQDHLGRWNDLQLFCRRLECSRNEAEGRGAVTLAGELEHLLAALEPVLASTRKAAVEASRHTANVVPMRLAARA